MANAHARSAIIAEAVHAQLPDAEAAQVIHSAWEDEIEKGAAVRLERRLEASPDFAHDIEPHEPGSLLATEGLNDD